MRWTSLTEDSGTSVFPTRRVGMLPVNVADWLHGLGLAHYEQAFRKNDIDAEVLLDLTEEDLVGLGIESIGHRRKLLAAIAQLRAASPPQTATSRLRAAKTV